MTEPIALYYGDNGSHEFYESEDSNALIIHQPNDGPWIALKLPTQSHVPLTSGRNAEAVIRTAADQYGLAFVINREREWRHPSRQNRMQLVEA